MTPLCLLSCCAWGFDQSAVKYDRCSPHSRTEKTPSIFGGGSKWPFDTGVRSGAVESTFGRSLSDLFHFAFDEYLDTSRCMVELV
jgi:hypothetical protein